jgi:hypothetical protein
VVLGVELGGALVGVDLNADEEVADLGHDALTDGAKLIHAASRKERS